MGRSTAAEHSTATALVARSRRHFSGRSSTDGGGRALIVQATSQGRRVVAAGTAVVEGLDPGQSAEFTGFFVGDPAGGELEVIVPPSNWVGAEGAPAPAAEGNPNDAGTDVVTDEEGAAPDDAEATAP